MSQVRGSAVPSLCGLCTALRANACQQVKAVLLVQEANGLQRETLHDFQHIDLIEDLFS